MKITLIGVKRMAGKGKKDGSPFDFSQLFGLVPVEIVSKDNLNISGAGFEIAEIPLDDDADLLKKFCELKYPIQLDLQMDSRPRFGKFESLCVAFTVVPAVKPS